MTILIVEDHTEARFYLTQFLNQQGAKVIASADAFDGLQAVREHHPDVILSDISMPNRDGFEFLREIRELGTENGGDVPVIAMTALGQIANRNRTMAAGFQAHLDKPFRPNQLLEAVRSVLDDND